MSQYGPADAVPPGALPAQRAAVSALAPRKRRMICQLIALVAIPAVLGLTLAGLQVTGAARSAEAYGQAVRLAVLARQINGLAQAIEDERSGTAVFISGGRPAAGLPVLRRQYAITDGRAARVRQLLTPIGRGYPAQTRASAAKALASIAELPGLRSRAAQRHGSALTLLDGYSTATSDLLAVNDGIAGLSGNPTLTASVQALGSLSRMMDQASQQQAILRVALAEGRFGPGALTALLTAQARQATDLVSFRDSATPEETWALTKTLGGPLPRQARAVEQRATEAGNGALALGAEANHRWWTGMSYTVGWMRYADQQLTNWITADARTLQRSAMRSAVITAGTALAALVLVLVATMMVARSTVRRLRRLETAALHAASEVTEEAARAREEARLRDGASAISGNLLRRSHSLLARLLRVIDNLEFSEEDPEQLAGLFQLDHLASRMWRNSDSALVLAGYQASRPSAGPLSLVDVVRGAVSEIEQYDRIVLDVQQGVSVSGSAATDTVHLVAELLENATVFSPATAQVTVSGHTARGGGSLIKIADSGTGMPEEQLRQLNWQLAHPSLADAAAGQPVGLFAVAHLAARHGVTVTLSMPPGGGTTAEVFLPAALISPGAKPRNWPRQAGQALRTGAGPLMLSAPVRSPAAGTSRGVTVLGPGYPQGGQATPAEQRVAAPATWAADGGPALAGLPRRVPRSSQVRGTAADQETRPATAAEPAEVMRSRLTSFQRGSRRARAVTQMSRSTTQPGQDG